MDRPQAKRFRAFLAKHFLIRFHMSLILAAVMAAAVLSSKLLLLAGLRSLPVRYPLAALSAYLVFLGLVRIWVAYVTRRGIRFSQNRSSIQLGTDMDMGFLSGRSASAPIPEIAHFGGGSSGGAGATRSFDVAASESGGSESGWMPSVDVDFDLDDGGWILIVLGILLAVLFGAGGYLIYIAPELLPEVAMQVVLASALKRASTKLAEGEWALSVVKGTLVPFLLVLGMTVVLGLVAHRSCPQATRLVEALHCPVI